MLLLILMVLCLPAALSAQTEVWPGIRTEEADQIPMWIEPFEAGVSSGVAAAQAIEQVVFADLDFCGFFQITKGKAIAAGKNKEFAVVVRGNVLEYGSDLYFEGKVIEISSGQFIGGKRYKLSDPVLRKVAHTFSDEVVHWLTGEKGIATTQIVFTRKNGDLWELLICDYDGYRPRTLLRQSTPIISPRWVDESRAIVYTSYRQGKPDLFIRYLNESQSRLIASYNGLNYSVDWSEEKKRLLATLSKDGNAEIYILRLDGRVERRLTHNRAIDCSPIWSPTGREVVFTSDRSGTPQLYIMEADGSNVRRLTFYGSYNASSVWEPGGEIIAFVSRIEGVFQLCSIRPDGSDQRMLTTDRVSHEDPRWAPDGRHLVYTERPHSGPVISVVDMTTGGKRILAQGEMPDWSLR